MLLKSLSGVIKGTEYGVLIIRVTVDDVNGVDGSLQALEIFEAILCRRRRFGLCGLFVILLRVKADDDRLLLVVDVGIFAVLAVVLSREILLDIRAERILVIVQLALILLAGELIYNVAVIVLRGGRSVLRGIAVVILGLNVGRNIAFGFVTASA